MLIIYIKVFVNYEKHSDQSKRFNLLADSATLEVHFLAELKKKSGWTKSMADIRISQILS